MIISAIPDCIYSTISEQVDLLVNTSVTNIDIRMINNVNVTNLTSEELQNVEKFLSSKGIKINTICSFWGKNKFNKDLNWEKERKELDNCFNVAKKLKCRNIRVFTYFCHYADKIIVQHSLVDKVLKYFTQIVSSSDINLCFENEKGTAFENIKDFYNLKKISKMKNIKMIFDIANFVNCGFSWEEQINMCLPFIEAVHIRDICKSIPQESVQLGYGDCFKKVSIKDFLKTNQLNLVYEPKLKNNINKKDIFQHDIATLLRNINYV